MDVLLVGSAEDPIEPGGDLLVSELRKRDIRAAWARWDDPHVDWSQATVVAVRSTWDYYRRRAEFLDWARKVEKVSTLLNGATAFSWNTDKSYLLDLKQAGIPIVPSMIAHTPDDLDSLRGSLTGQVVVKPSVGASGVGIVLLDSSVELAAVDLAHMPSMPWIVQPLVTSVHTEGEISVFVLGGRVVAQAKKVAAPGDIRVHEEHGGTTIQTDITDEAAGLARAAVRAAEHLLGTSLHYARVDLMRLENGQLVLSELEITEPRLYLKTLPKISEAFSELVAETVCRGSAGNAS